ncbi:MAG: ABC transporter permease [Candidatus Aminicenantes bacterium]|nr:ABC transporter permease [Candidatus Aminicenantes bacterium]
MFKNYLKVALRNLLKHKSYSFINILGLAVGIAASVLIALYVADELGYDRFHEKAGRIYRITADWSNKGDSRIHQLGTPAILAKTIRDNYPQAETVTQIVGPIPDTTIKYGEKAFKENEVFLAEPSFFQVFSFPLLEGDPQAPLRAPGTVILTQSVAAKLFGTESALDRTVQIYASGQPNSLKVTGVVRDVPHNSHFRFGLLVSMATYDPMTGTGWTRNNYATYLVLRDGVSQKLMEEKLVEIDRVYFEGGRPHIPWIWTLEPVTEIHLRSDLATGNRPNGSMDYVRLFALAAVLILLIAGINFVNLATARSARRAREVGIRKVVGSLRGQLIRQFLGESVLMSLVALILAIGLIQAALPFYRNLTEKAFALPYFGSPFVIPGLVGLALAVGILSGLYPAFFLSSFKQADVLKGSPLRAKAKGSLSLRNGLVVFQFAVSVLLIVGSLVIFRQLDFIKNKRLGFDKEHILVVQNAESLGTRLTAYREGVKRHPDVLGVTAVRSIPGQGTPNWGIGVQGVATERPLNMNFLTCDQDFAATLNIRMVEGRFLSRDYPSDTDAVVINAKAVEYFGLPDPIGKKIRIWTFRKDYTIIGIIDNIHFESLHKNVMSMGYLLPEAIGSSRRPYLLVKVNALRTYDVVAHLKRTWESMSSGLPFEMTFLDERVNGLYQNDIRAGKIVTLFSILSIFVSCLGLFGLAAYVTEQRTKEIGVRKVLGARLGNILWLLTGQFIKWVVVANLVAWPVGYWLMSRWLQGFAFRTSLSAAIFLASGLTALAIAVLTVGFQVVRAAATNPADSLRYE